jgi:hypothetical protein
MPFKGARKVSVLIKDTSTNLLDKVTIILFDKGFTIEQKDDKLKILSTKELPSKKWGTMSKIRIRINDTAIVFTSQIAINSADTFLGTKESTKSFMDVYYGGSKKSPLREAWEQMVEIASQVGQSIIYSK